MVDRAAQAAYKRAIAILGTTVTFQRVNPATSPVTVMPSGGAVVQAIVRGMAPDTAATSAGGYSANQVGSVDLADRQIIVMAADLLAASFPLPVRAGDQIILPADAGGETLSVVRADVAKLALGGAVECDAAGIG